MAFSDAPVVPIAIADPNYFIVDFYVISRSFRAREKIDGDGQNCVEDEILSR